MATWPASLPQYPRVNSLTVTYEPNVREFRPDLGPPIRRVARSNSFKVWTGTYLMTAAQHNAFWTFYNTTINYGIDQFTMVDPHAESSVTAEFQTTERPIARWIAPGYYELELSFRVRS